MQQLGDAVASDEPSLPGTAAVQQQQQQQQQQQRGVKDGTAHLEQAARRPGAQSAVATAHVEGRGAPAGAAAAAAAAPDELGAVWRHLKHLEKAVKVHLSQASSSSGATQQQHHASSSSSILDVLGGTSTGRRASSGASLASQDSGWGSLEQGGRSSSTVPAERARLLHGSLSVLKAEIADKAVKQVEAQLLQQRVAHLEAVLAVQGHVTAAGGSGFPSAPRASSGSSSIGGGGFSLGSIGGSMLGGTGGGAGGFSAQQRTSGGMNLEGATDVSLLYGRLGEMEAAMQQLAHAQVASTAVLSELGGRLGPSPTPGGGPAAGSAGASPVRMSHLRRPLSCPLPAHDLGSMGGWGSQFAGVPSAAGQQQPWARASVMPEPWLSSPPAAVMHHSSSSQFGTPSMASAAVQGSSHVMQEQQQPTQQQPQWTVDVVLAGHDAELAEVRDDLRRLQGVQQASAAVSGNTAATVARLEQRVRLLEQAADSTDAAHLHTSSSGGNRDAAALEASFSSLAGAAVAHAATTTALAASRSSGGGAAFRPGYTSSCGGSSTGALDSADLVSAIEGLADDAAQAGGRLGALEAASLAHAQAVSELCHLNSAAQAASSAQELPAAVLEQLLGSTQLQAVIDSRVEQLVRQAVAAQLAGMLPQPSQPAAVAATGEAAAADDECGRPALQRLSARQWPESLRSIEAQFADAAAAPPRQPGTAAGSRSVSTSQLELQMSALQQEVTNRQVQAMQEALESLGRRVEVLTQQQQAEHSVSPAVTSPPFPRPLEHQLSELATQTDSLAAQVAILHELAAAQPARFDVLQLEIEQLSHQLVEVNEGAADEPEVEELREQLAALAQQQERRGAQLAADIRAAAAAADGAAVKADAAAAAAAASSAAAGGQVAQALAQQLSAVEASLGAELLQQHAALSELQQQQQQLAAAQATSNDRMDQLAAQSSQLAHTVEGLSPAVDDAERQEAASTAAQADLAAKVAALEADVAALGHTAAASAAAAGSGVAEQQTAMEQLAAAQAELAAKVAALHASVDAAKQEAASAVAFSSAAAQAIAEQLAAAQARVSGQVATLEADVAALRQGSAAASAAATGGVAEHQPATEEELVAAHAQLTAHVAGLEADVAAVEQDASCAATFSTAAAEAIAEQLGGAHAELNAHVSGLDADVAALEQEASCAVTFSSAAAQEIAQQLGGAQAGLAARVTALESALDALRQEAAAAAVGHSASTAHCQAEQLTVHAELSAKLAALETPVTARAAALGVQLAQQAEQLRADEAQAAHDVDLQQQLRQQVDTMAQILAEVGVTKAQQEEVTHALERQLHGLAEVQQQVKEEHGAQLEALAGRLESTAQQLREQLSSAVVPLQGQVGSAAGVLQPLPAAVEGLAARLDEQQQMLRAADGERAATKEHALVLDQQLEAVHAAVQGLQGLAEQQESVQVQLQVLQASLAHAAELQQSTVQTQLQELQASLAQQQEGAELQQSAGQTQLQELQASVAYAAERQQVSVQMQLQALQASVAHIAEQQQSAVQAQLQELQASLAQCQLQKAAELQQSTVQTQLQELQASLAQQQETAGQQQSVLQKQLRALDASLAQQQEQCGRRLEALDQLLQSVVDSLSQQRQQHGMQLAAQATQLKALEGSMSEQQTDHSRQVHEVGEQLAGGLRRLQQEHAATAGRLAAATEALRQDVTADLARDKQQLAQAIYEVQAVVSEQCIKADQLSTIFAAQVMRSVFEASRQHDRSMSVPTTGSQSLSTLFAQAANAGTTAGTAAAPTSSGRVAEAEAAPALTVTCPAREQADVFDPFVELLLRGAAAVPGATDAPPPSAAAAAAEASLAPGPEQLAKLLETQQQLKAEVGALAEQLRAALADLAGQLGSVKQAQRGIDSAVAAERELTLSLDLPAATPRAWPATVQALTAAAAAAAAPLDAERASSGGVLHAPLSLVVQLQQELLCVKEELVSKEQFAAVVRLVRELRSHAAGAAEFQGSQRGLARSSSSSSSTPRAAHSGGPSCVAAAVSALEVRRTAAPAPADEGSRVAEVLQQHASQLAGMQASLEALLEAQKQPLPVAAAAKGGGSSEQQAAAQLREAAAGTQQSVLELRDSLSAHEQATKQQLQTLSACVDDLAAKLASAVNAAALAVAQQPRAGMAGPPAGASGFSEMVAGLARLKVCLDDQSSAVAALTSRLDDQEVALQGLLDSASISTSAAVSGSRSGALDGGASRSASISRAHAAAEAGQDGSSSSSRASVDLSKLVAELLAVQARLSAVEAAAASASEAAKDGEGAQPLGFMQGQLVELKSRMNKVEADTLEAKAAAVASAAAAAAAAPTPAAASEPAAGSPVKAAGRSQQLPASVLLRRGSAWGHHRSTNESASLAELQEGLCQIQADVARADTHSASLGAELESLRGDVGAAVAAAAAASAAASGGGSAAELVKASAASPDASSAQVAAAAAEEASRAATAAAAAQAGVDALAAQLQQLAERQLTGAATPRGSEGADPTAAAVSQQDLAVLRRQLLIELSSLQEAWAAAAGVEVAAAAAPAIAAQAAKAVDDLRGRLQELQAQVSEAAAAAAAAAASAAASAAAAPGSPRLTASTAEGAPAAAEVPDDDCVNTQLQAVAADLTSFKQQMQQLQEQMQEQQQLVLSCRPSASQLAADGSTAVLAGGNPAVPAGADNAGLAAPSVQQLVAELSALQPQQQAAFLTRLAGFVSRQAVRLEATYHADASLAAQLQEVKAQLSAFTGESGGSSSSRPTSMRRMSTATSKAASAGGSGEALLCILDQVASLRAIGSATHPAVSEALHRHEEQLQQLRAAHDSLAAAASALGSEGVAAGESDSASAAAGASDITTTGTTPAAAEAYEGAAGQRLADVETRLATGLKALAGLKVRVGPLQEVADATQSMMRELQVAHGLTLQRLEALEGLAGAGAAAAAGDHASSNATAGGVLAVAGLLQRLQADACSMSRRLSCAEAGLAGQGELAGTVRRLAARLADADGRGAALTSRVSSVAAVLPGVVGRMGQLERQLQRSLGMARQGLEILADQLVALGALKGRPTSPMKHALGSLGPNHAAVTALEGKVEAARTAMTASVKLMLSELAAAADDIAAATAAAAAAGGGNSSSAESSRSCTGAPSAAELQASVAALQGEAAEAARAAAASHEELLQQMEARLQGMQSQLMQQAVTAAAATAVAQQQQDEDRAAPAGSSSALRSTAADWGQALQRPAAPDSGAGGTSG